MARALLSYIQSLVKCLDFNFSQSVMSQRCNPTQPQCQAAVSSCTVCTLIWTLSPTFSSLHLHIITNRYVTTPIPQAGVHGIGLGKSDFTMGPVGPAGTRTLYQPDAYLKKQYYLYGYQPDKVRITFTLPPSVKVGYIRNRITHRLYY